MPIGIIVETAPGETRVAATPSTVVQLLKLGYEVIIERGAGAGSSFPDSDYETAGARLVEKDTAWGAEVVPAVTAGGAHLMVESRTEPGSR
jgi:NAD(P) transhydrogenase subunit alpha